MSVATLKSRLGGKIQGAQSPQGLQTFPYPSQTPQPVIQTPKNEMADMGAEVDFINSTQTAQTTVESTGSESSTIVESTPATESNYLALTTNAIDIINENLKNQPLSPALFDVIKAPTGGFTVFNVPGINGDEVERELVGIILDYTTPRAYWETPEPVEGTPPTCYSLDSIVSVEGKSCSTCVYNTFGSKGMNGNGIKDGDSNAKACKESIQAFLLRPDSIIPVIVRIPVTSKVIFQKYMTRLVSRMIRLSGVVTKITLEKATSNGGQPYAKFNFEAVEVLSQEEASYARSYGQKFSDMLGSSHDIHEVYDTNTTSEGVA